MTSQPFYTGAGAGASARGRRRARALPPEPTGSPGAAGRRLALLSALTAVLGAAFVYAPRLIAASTPGGGFSDQRSLIEHLRDVFVGYYGSGSGSFTPDMQRVVDYWFRYHVAKAVIAALLAGVLMTLAVLLWRTYLRADLGARSRAVVAFAWGFVSMLAMFSVALVAANIQGAFAPFASLLSMLPAAEPDAQFTTTLDQVKQGLAHYPNPDGHTSPALREMVGDFAFYHAVLAVVALTVALVLIGLSAVAWKRFARVKGDRRARRAFAVLGGSSVAVSLAVIVIAAANLTTVAAPAPALLAFFQGGW